MAKKEDIKTARKGGSAQQKKVSKEDLVEQMRKHKKEMQEVRFGLSKEAQQRGGSRKNLRKQVARAAAQLTVLRKNGAVNR